jgi:signal peptidase
MNMKTKKTAAWIVLSLIPAFAWFFTLRPASLGGPAGYVMVRGVSMLPTYVGGDLIVTHKTKNYAKGDIVAYKVPKGDFGAGIVVIHRIIGGDAQHGFIIQGDNNPDRDSWRPLPKDIVGKSFVRLPRVGIVLAFLHAPVPMASLAAGLVVAFILFPDDKKKKAKKAEALAIAQAHVEAEQASDDDALDLTRPLADLEDLRVSIEPGDGELLDEPVTTVDLNRFARNVDGHLGREELGHGGFKLERIPVLAKIPCVVHGKASVMDLCGHVGELELDRLERADRPPKLFAVPDVA